MKANPTMTALLKIQRGLTHETVPHTGPCVRACGGGIIAWPIAYIAVQYYLGVFLQRIDLTLLPFVLSMGFVLAAAWAAVATQVLHAARANPATMLRSE